MAFRWRNKMPQMVAEYEKHLPSYDEYINKEFRLDGDGYASVDLTAYDGLNWFDPLSSGEQTELNPELYDYLDRKAFYIPGQYPIRVRVKGSRLTAPECETVKRLFREHYTLGLWEELNQLKHNFRQGLSLAVLGALMLVLAFGIDRTVYGNVIGEMLMIVATFTFWESADFFMLRRNEIQVQRLYAGQMAVADIVFE